MDTKIHTQIIHAQSVKHNKEFKRLSTMLEKIEDSIYELEIELAKLYKKKHETKKKIQHLEDQVISTLSI